MQINVDVHLSGVFIAGGIPHPVRFVDTVKEKNRGNYSPPFSCLIMSAVVPLRAIWMAVSGLEPWWAMGYPDPTAKRSAGGISA